MLFWVGGGVYVCVCVCVSQNAPGVGQPLWLELSSRLAPCTSLCHSLQGSQVPPAPGILSSPPTARSRSDFRPQPCQGTVVSTPRGLGHEKPQTPSIQEQQMELLQGAYWCLNPPIPTGNTGADKRQFPTRSAVYIVITLYANSQGEVAEL